MKKSILILVLLTAACCAAQNGEAVLQADRAFAQAVAEKGLEGWMAFMAENSVRLGSPPVVGKEAVRAAMGKSFANPSFKLKWTPTHGEIFKGGDLGYTVGRYHATRPNEKGEPGTTTGTYLTIWQKQADGSWKVVWDGGSADPAKPAATPKPATKPHR